MTASNLIQFKDNNTKMRSSFLLSILLYPFLISSTPPALAHQSPSVPEKPIILTGQVFGFDEDGTFPLSIQLVYTPFCCQDQSTETAFLEPDGRFGFQLANSIAQDYLLELQRERRADEIAALRLASMREQFPRFPSEMLQCRFFDC